MRRVVWTDTAVDDLDAILAYVRQFSPLAAHRLGERLIETSARLSEHPDRGRLAPDGRRELTIIRPYRLLYRIADAEVTVLHVWHGARDIG